MFAAMNGETCSCFHQRRVGHTEVTAVPSVSIHIPLERANELSPEERLEGIEDLHGVSTAVPENPERLNSQMEELDMKMMELRQSKAVYEMAKVTDSEYVQRLRSQFLRASSFDFKEAASRLACHLECRQKLFGSQKVVGELTYADLSPKDFYFYSKGIVKLLPDRDRSGRAIIVVFGKLSNSAPDESIIRLHYVFDSILSRDEEIHWKGAVYIYFGHGQTQYSSPRAVALLKALKGIPLKCAAAHLCYDNPFLHAFANAAAFAMAARELVRFKCHFGSVLECLYSLRAFGIPPNAIPINSNGAWDPACISSSAHATHLSSHELVENLPPNEVQLEPQAIDVLMGRGKRGLKSIGNQRLKRLHEEYRESYENGNRGQKNFIVQSIYNTMIDSGSRFMAQTSERQWTAVSMPDVKKSISHGFRNMRRMDRERMLKTAMSCEVSPYSSASERLARAQPIVQSQPQSNVANQPGAIPMCLDAQHIQYFLGQLSFNGPVP